MIGEVGWARTRLEPEGKIFVHGEIWNAWSEEVIDEGESVEVEDVQGLTLKVKKPSLGPSDVA
jgi:membrane-bound serine protease (ClpP class)